MIRGIVIMLAAAACAAGATTAGAQTVEEWCPCEFRMSARTNLLYDGLLAPNAGVEFHLGHRWAIGADGLYSRWSDTGRGRYVHGYGGELTLRRYFGGSAPGPLTRHHIGLYGQILAYDVEWDSRGNQSDLSYGGGIEYGYTLPLGSRLNLDISAGIGYLGGVYREYTPRDGHYVWERTRRRHWFGPTRAGISLVWLIGRGNVNRRKGGMP